MATALVNAARKVLKKVHERYPDAVKYLVAEPRYWDLEPPKYFVPDDHHHPLAASTPSVDYNAPEEGVRELDLGPVRRKDGHAYHARDFRRNSPPPVEFYLSADLEACKQDLREACSKLAANEGFAPEDTKHAELVDGLLRTARFHGRLNTNHPNNRDNTEEENCTDEYTFNRYHSDEVQAEWEQQQFELLDKQQAASRIQQ